MLTVEMLHFPESESLVFREMFERQASIRVRIASEYECSMKSWDSPMPYLESAVAIYG